MKPAPRLDVVLAIVLTAALQAGCGDRSATMDATRSSVATDANAAPGTPVLEAPAAGPPATAPDSARIEPGVYATELGWGHLSIKSEDAHGLTFALETENSGDGCSFSGRIDGTQAVAQEGRDAGACKLDLDAKGETISIASKTADACRALCGYNGSYEGDYVKLSRACEPAAVDRARSDFQTLYDKRDYAKAESVLAPVYRDCLATLAMVDEGGVRNDYALTQHKLGDDAACLAALERYGDEVDETDDEVTDGMAPAIADDYLSVIRAARTNTKLCGRKPER